MLLILLIDVLSDPSVRIDIRSRRTDFVNGPVSRKIRPGYTDPVYSLIMACPAVINDVVRLYASDSGIIRV